jgi:hypothetical protein
MSALYSRFFNYFRRVNWMLMLFLVLVLNVKMLIKIFAIVLIVLLNRKMILDKTIYRQKFVWFYASLIIIALINLGLSASKASMNYLIVVAIGILFWVLCIATIFIVSWFIKNTSIDKLHATLTLFFVVNIAVTLGQLAWVIIDSGSLNPYLYQGMNQKYFISTGDRMTGLSFDVSTTNALLNTLGIIYFLYRNKIAMVFLCMATLLLAASNFTNILLVLVLIAVFIFKSSPNQKSIIFVCLFLQIIFMVKISPQNNQYVRKAFNRIAGTKIPSIDQKENVVRISDRPDSTLTEEERKQKTAQIYLDSIYRARLEAKQKLFREEFPGQPIVTLSTRKPAIPKPDIHSKPYQRIKDTTIAQKELLKFASNLPEISAALLNKTSLGRSGKLVAFKQTIQYMRQYPIKLITGAGMGNFSSKLAFRATSLRIAGGFPSKYSYIHEDFRKNHLAVYLAYYSKDAELHSVTNSPNSVYNQLLGEYGLLGILSFGVFYLGFFAKYLRRHAIMMPLLMILLGAFFIEYLFEQLSVVIFFEFIVLMHIKIIESSKSNSTPNHD